MYKRQERCFAVCEYFQLILYRKESRFRKSLLSTYRALLEVLVRGGLRWISRRDRRSVIWWLGLRRGVDSQKYGMGVCHDRTDTGWVDLAY